MDWLARNNDRKSNRVHVVNRDWEQKHQETRALCGLLLSAEQDVHLWPLDGGLEAFASQLCRHCERELARL